ncbi:MAG TPA: TROVE domain-containing protein [Methylomicrobium sp.]|nr:TROVE domain-containing protein [Methylomicrobium sp.]
MSALRDAVAGRQKQTVKDRQDQVKNSAGGYVYRVSDEDRLRRFLIIGSNKGTYYVSKEDATQKGIEFIEEIVSRDPEMVARVTFEVSFSGRAPKNTAAIFVAAVFICRCPDEYKPTARRLVNQVCRTSTHIFEFCEFVDKLGGWGQAKMKAVKSWYTSRTPDQLAYQAIKYRGGRYGWSHRDVLRTAHPTGIDERVGSFMLGKALPPGGGSDIIDGFLEMQSARTESDVIKTLDKFPTLPWETIPTHCLRSPRVWSKLVYNGAVSGTALIRNIGRMDQLGCFKDMTLAATVRNRLTDPTAIRRARLHPVQYLNAMAALGLVPHAGSSWGRAARSEPLTSQIVAGGLEEGFYASFDGVALSGERVFIAIDVSGSMAWSSTACNLTCAQGATALAMVIARRNPVHMIYGFKYSLCDLGVTPGDSLFTATKKTSELAFGSTDCSAPMRYAETNRIGVDKFIVLTDNETWSGHVKPDAALREYRNRMGIDAKLIVVGMTDTDFTIADPNDVGMLDVCGFDTTIPELIRNF